VELKKPVAARGQPSAICRKSEWEGGREAVDYRILEGIAERRRRMRVQRGSTGRMSDNRVLQHHRR
jgi:hypothetical protein